MILDIPIYQPSSQAEMIFFTRRARQWAAEFCQHHQSDPRKAEQVYCNTLAVWAVHEWLQSRGIETDLESSYSWDPLFQTCMNVADLVVPEQGRLECRPVIDDADSVMIPPETWEDRLGYIAVQLDESLETASILGYVKTAEAEVIALDQFQDSQSLIEQLQPSSDQSAIAPIAHLSKWFHHQIEQGWQTLDELFGQSTLAFDVRSTATQQTLQPSISIVQRGKPVTLTVNSHEHQMFLVVEIKSTTTPVWEITISLVPDQVKGYLPPNLELLLLDDAGVAVMQAQSRATKLIGLEFSGEMCDRFSAQIVMGDQRVTETFVI